MSDIKNVVNCQKVEAKARVCIENSTRRHYLLSANAVHRPHLSIHTSLYFDI